MSRKQWIAIALIAAAAALVAWVSRSTRQPPLLPADATHAAFESAATCLSCHGPGAPVPRSSRHPLGDECLRCHGSRK
jgi:mono/diheme cytochrome c family protein